MPKQIGKNVLIAALHFAYLKGGGEHYPLNVAQELAKQGWQPEFLCGVDPFWRPRPLSRQFPVHMVPFLYVLRHLGETTKGKLGTLLRICHYIPYLTFSTLFLLLRSRSFAVINTHDILSLQAAVICKRLLPKTRVVATLHGQPLGLEQKLLRRVDAVISVNEVYRDELVANGIQNVHVVSTGANFELFHPGDKREARTETNLPLDRKILLFVGRLIPLKNISHLLKVMAELLTELPEALLVVVGEGSVEEQLKAEAEQLGLTGVNVMFKPAVPQEKVPSYFRSADAFILPSTTEAFPMVGIEAMACGVPVLMTKKSPGFARAFDEETVATVDPFDVAQTKKQVKAALTGDQSARIKRQSKAVESYSWESQAAKTIAIFTDVQAT